MVRAEPATSHRHQHACDAPHHLPQEVRTDDADEHEVAGFDDGHLFEQHFRRLFPRVVVGERLKVGEAHQRRAASTIRATFSGSRTHHTNGLAKAVRRVAIW